MADEMLVQPTQRNSVLGLIAKAGLDPLEFAWDEWESSATQRGPGWEPLMVSVLIHVPTEYFFLFDLKGDSHNCTFSPGNSIPRESAAPVIWSGQLDYVENWLSYLKREYEAPDMWRELGRARDLGELPTGVENTPFTADERARIEAQLRAVLERVRQTHELTTEQLRVLEAKVDEAVEATRSFNRLDWRKLFIGSMIEVAMAEVVSFAVVGEILRLALQGIVQLYGGDLPALPP